MNKGLKIALITISIFIILILSGPYIISKIISEAFGPDCEIHNTWIVKEYEIVEYKCLGWVGPHYFPLDLHKNGEYMTTNGVKLDSCNIRFTPKNGYHITLNTCNHQITELKAQKNKIDYQNVDSILLTSKINSNKTKKLNQIKTETFIKDWNNSKICDYREGSLDSIFHPNYHYKLNVFENGKKREFVTFNYLIVDQSNWTYYITNSSDTEYMNRLWNE